MRPDAKVPTIWFGNRYGANIEWDVTLTLISEPNSLTWDGGLGLKYL